MTTSTASRGVLASVVASVLFGVLFFLPPLLAPLSGNEVFGARVILTLPVVAAIFMATGQWRDVVDVTARVRRRPTLVLAVPLNGLLLGVQVWLFGWAPQSGHGLDAALGYLLLPLVMVVVGILVHREGLSFLRGAAVAAAAVGVLAALIANGGLSWVTLVVALGYPLYFTLRRRWRLDTSGALCLELAVLVPVAVWFVTAESTITTLVETPSLLLKVVLLGIVSGVALVLYLAASRLLPFGLFGLLTYLEPVLLVAVSIVLLGERATPSDALVYGPIALALVLLAVEPARNAARQQPPSHARHPE
ncbi:EamA family transporter RarD [Micromonospora pallida]|uniref:EamA family transporter RarD n=1 Tax=Micromonospora pallida TaxID=145854 RepID=UPI00159EF848|nr:EamA family transporter RarD [Micromonospora pallida]